MLRVWLLVYLLCLKKLLVCLDGYLNIYWLSEGGDFKNNKKGHSSEYSTKSNKPATSFSQ